MVSAAGAPPADADTCGMGRNTNGKGEECGKSLGV